MKTIKYSMMFLFVAGAAFSQEQSKYTTPKPFDSLGINLNPPAVRGAATNTKPAGLAPIPVGPLWPIPLERKVQNPGKTTPAGKGITLKPEVFGPPSGMVMKIFAQFNLAAISIGPGEVEVGDWCEVRRNGKLIGRIRVRRVEASRSICLVRRHEMLSPLQVGDQVIAVSERTAKRH